MHFSQLFPAALILATSHGSNGAVIKRGKPYRSVSRDTALVKHTLPQLSTDAVARAAAIATTKAGFLYGPSVAGGPYYPAGSIGNLTALADLAALEAEYTPEGELAEEDAELGAAAEASGEYDGLATLEDYTLLYERDTLVNTLPAGPAPGILTNYTQDLLFSMERLSFSPYAIRRLSPSTDILAFDIDNSTVQQIAGSTLPELFQAGRLFYADHSAQGSLNRTAAYAPACDAYFYIDETSGDFLPLAIRTGVGANLIYTPQDDADDWLLAKMMYNVNDVFFAQLNHLAATHEVVQIAWMAAIRTISVNHPIYALLDRLMYQVFGVQPIAMKELFASGAAIDQIFGYTGTAAQQFTSDLYFGGSGKFEANYFLTNLQNRGLINSAIGPNLRDFPFYEDASVIYTATRAFISTFVGSYYASDDTVLADDEIQAWANDANVNGEALDFPTTISSREELIDVITHMAHLVTTAHHSVNTNNLLTSSMTLPFHPSALYSEIPTTKGNTSVVSFMPPYEKCTAQLYASGFFARPLLADTNRTLLHMFDDDALLVSMNDDIAPAAAKFKATMEAFSEVVSNRTFDANGLSQGMPFVWQALDPNVAPYSITI